VDRVGVNSRLPLDARIRVLGADPGGFAGHVKLMFVNGAALAPVPPVTPVGMGKATRGVELESVENLDQRQIADWMKQVAAVPGVGRKKH
jgi:hypothetical protein